MIAKCLPDLVYEHYRLSGRHERTRRPFKDTLQKLGLEEFMDWSQLDQERCRPYQRLLQLNRFDISQKFNFVFSPPSMGENERGGD
jgi:hypothetical protein